MPIDKVKFPNGETEDIRDSRVPGIDSAPTANSANLVTSGGVKSALDGYLPLTGGTMSGHVTFEGGELEPVINFDINRAVSGGGGWAYAPINIRNAGNSRLFNIGVFGGNADLAYAFLGLDDYNGEHNLRINASGLSWGSNTVWHQGNDGSGSGLDADLLDGLQPSQLDVNTAKTLKGYDNRGVDNPPSWYMSNPGQISIFTEFAQAGGAISYPNFESRTTFTPWGDASGGRPTQLSLSDSGAFFRTSASDSAWNSWKQIAFTDSNVASATKLQTVRTIWGQSFDGTDNVDGILTLTYASAARATGIEVMSSNSGEASIGFTSTNRTVFGRYADRGFIWGSVAGEIMTLLDNGNVGIGTDTPIKKLSVAGGIGAIGEESMFSNSTYTDPAVGIACGIKVSGGLASTGDTYLSTLSGNVGIGTTSAASKLTVAGTIRSENQSDGSPSFRTDGANSYTALASFLGGSRKWQIDTINDGSMRLYLDSAGKYLLNMWPSGIVEIDGGITTTLQTSEPSGGMLPNREYQLGTLSGNTTFTLAAGTSGVTNHYFWSFETGSTAPTITWPSAITSWYGGSAPTINASKHYEVSVLNGVAVVMEV